jgi:hypothetical protein
MFPLNLEEKMVYVLERPFWGGSEATYERTRSHLVQDAMPVQRGTGIASCNMISLVVCSNARRISSNLTTEIRSYAR